MKEEAAPALDAVPFADTKDSVIAIINGKLVNSEEILESDILVEGGKITKIEKNLEIPEGAKVIDAQDRFVLPGGVDYGTRILSREFTDSDGVAERTKSFILGGITTIVDSIQSDDFEKSFEFLKVLKDSENGFYCDLSVKLHVPEWNDETEAVVEKSATEFGVRSFHVNPEKVSDEELLELGRVVAGVGGVLCVDAVTGSEDTRTPAEDIEEGLVRRVCSLAHQVQW